MKFITCSAITLLLAAATASVDAQFAVLDFFSSKTCSSSNAIGSFFYPSSICSYFSSAAPNKTCNSVKKFSHGHDQIDKERIPNCI